MLFRITAAATLLLMTASVSVAQYPPMYPSQTRGMHGGNQEVPIVSTAARRNQDQQTQHGAGVSITNAPSDSGNVGDNYFQKHQAHPAPHGHHGYNSGYGNDCHTGNCGVYNDCATQCLGRYFRVFGGWNFLDDMEAALGTAAAPADFEFRDGWVIGAAIGDYVSCNLRRELEFTYRHNSGDTAYIGRQPIGDIDGSIQAYSVMGNLVYELNNLNLAGFRPYTGGGIGIAFVDGNFNVLGDNYSIDDAAFAYQVFGGVDRQISHNARAFVEYRYFGTSDIEIVGPVATTEDKYVAQSLLFGIHFQR